MEHRRALTAYFSRGELVLWGVSAALAAGAFLLFDGESWLTLTASLVGVTSLIFNAKGNPLGQLLMVLFSVLYGIISWEMAYYGEMITYLGMTGPMAVYALVAWLRHPFRGNRAEVQVNRLRAPEYLIMAAVTGVVTWVFYHILAYFHTANLLPSTLSVTTSFLAAYLTARRSEYYAIGYAANDGVLILLWVLAAGEERRYLSVVACFVAFLFNDLYGYVSWRRMRKRQLEAG